MIDPRQFRDYVIIPALQHIGFHSPAAEQILLGTALTESNLVYIDQVDKTNRPGPAFGPFQMERRTHNDHWDNWLDHRPEIAAKVSALQVDAFDRCMSMHGNHYYAAAMCRVHYLRVRWPLPQAGDFLHQAEYWKKHYNTVKGKGTVDGYLRKIKPMIELYGG